MLLGNQEDNQDQWDHQDQQDQQDRQDGQEQMEQMEQMEHQEQWVLEGQQEHVEHQEQWVLKDHQEHVECPVFEDRPVAHNVLVSLEAQRNPQHKDHRAQDLLGVAGVEEDHHRLQEEQEQ